MNQLETQRTQKAIRLLDKAFEHDPPYTGPELERIHEAQYAAVTEAMRLLKLNLR